MKRPTFSEPSSIESFLQWNAYADSLEAQLSAAEAELTRVKAERDRLREAARRYCSGNVYPKWANSGGPNECPHGYGEGFPCVKCDRELLLGPEDNTPAQSGIGASGIATLAAPSAPEAK